MPDRMMKRCGCRGCPNTTRDRYCAEHAPWAAKYYDQRRGSTTERGYDGDWKRLAEQRRQIDAELCQSCLALGRLSPSPLVDHIVPIHIRPDWRLELGNTQVLCRDCHTRKTSEDMRRYGGRTGRAPSLAQSEHIRAAQALPRPRRDDEVDSC